MDGAKKLGRNEPCWCGSGRKYKRCHLPRQNAAAAGPGTETTMEPLIRPAVQGRSMRLSRPSRGASSHRPAPAGQIKTAEQIAGIRKAGRMTRDLLDLLEDFVKPGLYTEDINRLVHEKTLAWGGVPAPLNYRGFPKSVCTSVNEVVCHGIPGPLQLRAGDIINVDVTSIVDGYFGDASRMYAVGSIAPAAQKLIEVCRECLERGIAEARPGGYVGNIGAVIQEHAEAHNYGVVRDFVGHGTGVEFHEPLQIPHFGVRGRGEALAAGMVFTVEPMINLGDWRVRILADGWTAVTMDGSLSAQWEHTILVTEEGDAELLTG